MADAEIVEVYGDEYEVSAKNGRWITCDLDNGFLVLISDVVSLEYIEEVFDKSDYESWQYNKIFKSKNQEAWCLRMNLPQSGEETLQQLLEKFNV
tara:strand:- start:882 stop:1166 length:285 start_codon:yes stop_codon:yes gene_type:complete